MSEASGKLLLFGEHAAVFGYPALGIALNKKLRIEVEGTGDLCFETAPLLPKQQKMLSEFLDHLKKTTSLRGTIKITSEIPVGVGLGSSAALCVAIARLLHPEDEVLEKAQEFEKIFHQNPSGVDTSLSFYNQACYFSPKPQMLNDFSYPLVIGALPRKTSTKSLIQMVASHPEKERHLHALGQIAESSQDGNLAELANLAQNHLRALDLSTPELDLVLERGKELGALGGKLSGAGGGGAYFLVAPSFEDATRIAEELKNVVKHNLNSFSLI